MALPVLSAAAFQPSPVSCPGCHEVLKAPADACHHCGYTGWTCHDRFPWIAPPLERYVDVDQRLTEPEMRRLDACIESLETRLPQVRIFLCLGKLYPGTDVREFGFWLFNSSVPRDSEEAEHRPWGILLTIDRTACTAALTIGYGLDPFLDDKTLTHALAAGVPEFRRGRFGRGGERIIIRLESTLLRAQREAAATMERLKNDGRDGRQRQDERDTRPFVRRPKLR